MSGVADAVAIDAAAATLGGARRRDGGALGATTDGAVGTGLTVVSTYATARRRRRPCSRRWPFLHGANHLRAPNRKMNIRRLLSPNDPEVAGTSRFHRGTCGAATTAVGSATEPPPSAARHRRPARDPDGDGSPGAGKSIEPRAQRFAGSLHEQVATRPTIAARKAVTNFSRPARPLHRPDHAHA